jgi:nucleoside-diphosphate-sugar epimerase
LAQTEFAETPPGDLLITGATGFLGGRFVRELLARGCAESRLRCLVRDPTRAARAGLPAASLRLADLAGTDEHALRAAAAGVGTVVHFAGAIKGLRAADFDAVNGDGTARLCAAVRDAAPGAHVVCISSLAAAGPSIDGRTSALPPDATRPVSWYGTSKRLGELAVVASGLAHTILRPPVVYGPDDDATRLLFRQAGAFLVVAPSVPRPLSVIHADDVVAAVLRTITLRPAGAYLPLAGPEDTDTHTFLRAIAGACGRRPRLVSVPFLLAAGAANLCDFVARLRRTPGFFSRDKIREIAAAGWVADPEPASRVLGFRARIHLADGLLAVARESGLARN